MCEFLEKNHVFLIEGITFEYEGAEGMRLFESFEDLRDGELSQIIAAFASFDFEAINLLDAFFRESELLQVIVITHPSIAQFWKEVPLGIR